MKKILFLPLLVLALTGCQDVINLDTETGPSQLVVDGWVTNQTGPQTIKLTQSAAYFDNSTPKPVLGATVTVTDEANVAYRFQDLKNTGEYVWTPPSPYTPLGHVSGTYRLSIKTGTEEYQATTQIRPGPRIDSVNYYFDKPPVTPQRGPKEGYVAEFYARDLPGKDDTYWIKTFKNGKYFNRASDISLAYDAGFSPGGNIDGIVFILPIRRSINKEYWSAGDTLRVELHSIPVAAYYFLQAVNAESGNQGLFATPPTNIPTNVTNLNANGRKALGFFGGSSVNTLQTVIDPKKARPKP
jgi:hypothetical protein